jgi:RNA polymerase sigma-70 factor, ECF subfamily
LVASAATIAAPGGAISFVADTERRERERDLVRAAQAGDVAAFERLYRENLKRVYALCYRMSGSAQLAEELAQDVFVRAWQKLASFRGDSAFSSWLHPIAVNVAYSERRARVRRESRVSAHDDLTPFEGGEAKHPQPALGVDLERAIGGLPEGAREVFVLHDVEGLKHEEIAGLVGIAVGTSKAQLHRARRLLREALQR